MTPAAPGRVLGSVTPDVLPSHQHHCNVDKWRSLGFLPQTSCHSTLYINLVIVLSTPETNYLIINN